MDDIEAAVRGFEGELGAIQRHARACVELFASVDDERVRYLLAERLGFLGSLIIPDLVAVIDDPARPHDTRYLAAWAGVRAGERGRCVEVLCAEVESDLPWSWPAAAALARFEIDAGLGVIGAALERLGLSDQSKVVGYLAALRDLGGTLSKAARVHVLSSGSELIARAVEQDFPTAGPHRNPPEV